MLPRGSGIRTEKKRGALRARTGPEGRQGTAHAVCDAADRSGGEAFAGRGAGAGGRQLHALSDDGNDRHPRRHRPGRRPPRPEGSPGGPDRGHRGRERTVHGGLTASSTRPPARAARLHSPRGGPGSNRVPSGGRVERSPPPSALSGRGVSAAGPRVGRPASLENRTPPSGTGPPPLNAARYPYSVVPTTL